MIRWVLVLVGLFLAAAELDAHEVRPGYLRIQQTGAEHYDILWRVPARGDLRLSIHARLPDHCEQAREASAWQEGGTFVQRWAVDCPGGIVGHRVEIDGLSSLLIDVLVRFQRLDETTQVVRLTPSDPGFVVTAAETWTEVAATYGMLGIEHILLGFDHLLFVLALLLLVPNLRMLIWTVTAFTVAHSLTLAAATLGWVHVPGPPVEAVIAISILFVAMEIVHSKQGHPGITRRWPWLVSFVFGLLHGFGFAGALSDIGLPEHAIPLALLFFNLGVEAGQLIFIMAVLVVWAAIRHVPWPQWGWRVPVYAIGSLAAFWTIERISSFA